MSLGNPFLSVGGLSLVLQLAAPQTPLALKIIRVVLSMRAQIIRIHSFKPRTHFRPVAVEPQIVAVEPEPATHRTYCWRWLCLIPLLPVFFLLASCSCILQVRKNG